MTADERSDDQSDRVQPFADADELVERALAEVRAARAAVLKAFHRQRRRGVEWTDEDPAQPGADAPDDGGGAA